MFPTELVNAFAPLYNARLIDASELLPPADPRREARQRMLSELEAAADD